MATVTAVLLVPVPAVPEMPVVLPSRS